MRAHSLALLSVPPAFFPFFCCGDILYVLGDCRQQAAQLDKWLRNHNGNLYPCREDKEALAVEMQMTYLQVRSPSFLSRVRARTTVTCHASNEQLFASAFGFCAAATPSSRALGGRNAIIEEGNPAVVVAR